MESKYKRDSLTRIVRLYEALEKPEKVVEWQQKLDDFDKTEAVKNVDEKASAEAGEKDESHGH